MDILSNTIQNNEFCTWLQLQQACIVCTIAYLLWQVIWICVHELMANVKNTLPRLLWPRSVLSMQIM